MKIKVDVLIELTPEQAKAYAHEYGIAATEIRDDVRTQVRTLTQECEGGAFWTASVKN